MGATGYTNFWIGQGSFRDAVSELRSDAASENGHQQGYSGDIQTANGFSKYNGELPKYDTEEFYEKTEELAWEMDKGECQYVELMGAALKKAKDRTHYKGKKGIKAFYFFGCGNS